MTNVFVYKVKSTITNGGADNQLTIFDLFPRSLARFKFAFSTKSTLSDGELRELVENRGLRVVDAKLLDQLKKGADQTMPVVLPASNAKPLRVSPATSQSYSFIRVAPGKLGSLFFRRLTSALKTKDVLFFKGGSPDRWAGCVNISDKDLGSLLTILEDSFGHDTRIGVEIEDRKAIPLSSYLRSHPEPKSSLKLIYSEKPVSKKGVYCSVLYINLWSQFEQHSGKVIYESGLTTPYAKRIRVPAYEKLQKAGDISKLSKSLSTGVEFPVDVVYTWVNDQDVNWQAQRANYGQTSAHIGDNRATHAERFRNRDELRYSLRSLDQFAPFVRNVFIVTSGQVPDWLNIENPRVKVVPHDEIYKDASELPTFNSSGIETQLHHIDGLSEYFLYFNDDFFLGELCSAEDFFFTNGVLKYFPTEQRVFEPDVDETSEEYLKADANAIRLLKKKYGAYNREIMLHVPYPSSRTLLYQLEKDYEHEFRLCSSSRFRASSDLRPIAFLQYHFGFQEKLAMPSSITHQYLALWKPTIDRQLAHVLKNRRHKTFCVNDVGVADEKVDWTNRIVLDFLEKYFPFKSSFER